MKGSMQIFSRLWRAIAGPTGWRSVVGPFAFVLAAIALLVYDHLNHRVTDVVFWLTLGLILGIFARMLETNRRQSRQLAEQQREAIQDRTTGLRNRPALESDIAAAATAPGDGWVLVAVELSGVDTQVDRRGYAAGDALLRGFARQLLEAVTPLGGIAYRVGASRLAALVPAGDRSLGEIVLATTGSLHSEDAEVPLGRAYGEVTIPDEAADAETALRVAGQRLATQRERQQRSARRQAHAVLMEALSARHPELRDDLRVAAYRAISLARRLGMGPQEIDDVALAAELQGIGLLAAPEPEPGGEHPLEGERIAAAAPGLASVAALVRSSAERYDGSGGPDRLAGEAIPAGARVVAVAVAFARLTAPRSHRPAPTSEDALADLRSRSGTQFDPRVVEALAAELAEESAPLAAAPLQTGSAA